MQSMLQLHSPQQLQDLSNFAHWAEGAIFLAVSLILLAKLLGLIKSKKIDLIWPALILFAGLFLIIYIFIHHPISQLGTVWQAILSDPQQTQHFIMALLLIGAAALQLLYSTGKLTLKLIPFIFPAVVLITGLMFIFHPQHGTDEAIRYMLFYHRSLGSVLVLAGLVNVFSVYGNQKNKLTSFVGVSFLLVASILLLLYREPIGSYRMDKMGGMKMGNMGTVSHGGQVKDYVSLVDNLRSKDLVVEPQGEINQPFFEIPGQSLKVDNEMIQVFEFSDEQNANSESKKISPDGSGSSTTMITWIDTPHFYKKGTIIALYIGKNPKITNMLTELMGPQFAGR